MASTPDGLLPTWTSDNAPRHLRGAQAHTWLGFERCRVFEMEYTSRGMHLDLRRSMNDEWPHREHAARRDVTLDGADPLRPGRHLLVRQHALRMSPGQHAQRPVFGRRIVEMQAQRHDCFEH